MNLVPNPKYKIWNEEKRFMDLLTGILDIVEDIKEDERLKDGEYLGLMRSIQMLHKLKSQLKAEVIYIPLRDRTRRNEPTQWLRRKKQDFLCNDCGRGFTSEKGLEEHKTRKICFDTNTYASYCMDTGNRNPDLQDNDNKEQFVNYYNQFFS